MLSILNLKILTKNTIQKEIRNKTILFLFIFTILILLMAYGLINMFYSQMADENMLSNFGLGLPKIFISVLSLWTSIVALLVGVNVIRSDMDEKVLPQLLALPITRLEYLLSRLIGSWIIVMSFYLLCVIFTYGLFFLISREFTSVTLVLKSLPPLGINIFIVLWMGMFFSQYFPKIFALLTTTFVLSLVRVSNSYFTVTEVSSVYSDTNVFGMILSVFYFLFPRLGEWGVVNSQLINGVAITVPLNTLMIHTAASSLVIFALGFWLFKRRDL